MRRRKWRKQAPVDRATRSSGGGLTRSPGARAPPSPGARMTRSYGGRTRSFGGRTRSSGGRTRSSGDKAISNRRVVLTYIFFNDLWMNNEDYHRLGFIGR